MSARAPSIAQKAALFLALTFAFSWGACFAGWSLLPQENVFTPLVSLTAMMAGPAIAAGLCVALFERGARARMLGLHWRPNPWWLIAWATPVVLAAASVVLTLIVSGRGVLDPGTAAIDALRAQGQSAPPIPAPALTAIILFQALLAGALINAAVLTFTEELGWRGYLYGLWRRFGFWRYTLATGAIWGLWHAPAIVLFGHNYPDHRWLGVGLFTAFCMLLSVIMTVLRDRGRSVIAAGIAHGALNAVAGVSVLMIDPPDFPWNGLLGIAGYAALALGAALFAWLGRNDPADAPRES